MEQGRINIKMKQATPTASKMQMAYTDQHTIGQVNVSVAMCNECAALEHFFCCLFSILLFILVPFFPLSEGGRWRAVAVADGGTGATGGDSRRFPHFISFYFRLFLFSLSLFFYSNLSVAGVGVG